MILDICIEAANFEGCVIVVLIQEMFTEAHKKWILYLRFGYSVSYITLKYRLKIFFRYDNYGFLK